MLQSSLSTDRGTDLNNEIIDYIKNIVSEDNVHIDEPMSRHTTFRTGGPASLFLRPRTTEEIKGVLKLLKRAEVDFFILGNGSNLLVSDKGFDGVIISLANFADINSPTLSDMAAKILRKESVSGSATTRIFSTVVANKNATMADFMNAIRDIQQNVRGKYRMLKLE